ncbi:hypothetical protein GOHSU_12_00940 [Gordonia hirsuta DSM 44140 = NBRC 16056]|uniref:Peptidase S1 domain-containing protein n=1 Tax=Gordonia hirsuta DSM 44140 = NBRC 16056 TaxID=1121927 RepID=L7L6Z3_9ACTN|nr:hypothetical protein [Gordonia hirsuta]GAC56704.1 hypothetical protein GOHSU_12_00940 [Gordonia hirsuta DSM 44140 = NBRC 16056]
MATKRIFGILGAGLAAAVLAAGGMAGVADAAPFGDAPGQVEQDGNKVKKREILRDSSSYQYLSAPQRLEPGAKYHVARNGKLTSSCSLGWTVRQKSDPNRLFNLTAGHCGNKGDDVYLDPKGAGNPSDMVKIGRFAWSKYDGDSKITTGDDYALIELLPEMKQYLTGTPNMTLFDQKQSVVLQGWQSAEWLAQAKPYMCRLGYRSGITCGQFQDLEHGTNVSFDGITDQGDSGGVIWAFDPADTGRTKIYAVAVTSWVNFGQDAATSNGKTIDRAMKGLDLQILR